MAEAGGAGGGSPPDVLWTFPGQISTDQDSSIFSYKARKATSFIGFDVNARLAPTGTSILVDWAVNGVVNPNLRVTVVIGQTYGETIFPLAMAVNDELRPILTQVGSSLTGQTIIMRARGS